MSDLPTIYVSPAEPPGVLRGLGPTSSLPEKFGVDFLWRTHEQWFGVQRKEFKDFLASARDGRLAKELQQMRASVVLPMVIVEGEPRYTLDGRLLDGWGKQRWTRQSITNLAMSVRHEGAHLLNTPDTLTTAAVVAEYVEWSTGDHDSLKRRGGVVGSDPWGRVTNHDYAGWVLQGLPGIGPAVASAILKHFGKVPFTWDVTEEELCQVPGIGKVRARQLMEVFEQLEQAS